MLMEDSDSQSSAWILLVDLCANQVADQFGAYPGISNVPSDWEYFCKNTTQCPRPGLEPGPLAPESSTLTRRPLRLPPAQLH